MRRAIERCLRKPGSWPNFPIYGASWQANVEDGDARVAEARGLYADAEAGFHKAAASYLAILQISLAMGKQAR